MIAQFCVFMGGSGETIYTMWDVIIVGGGTNKGCEQTFLEAQTEISIIWRLFFI
jgi:hypothetical protein